MTHASVVDVLTGRYAVGTTQTVKGWIRTRRDSKAGISFLAISDGSCFHPVQAVVPNTLANYENEVLRLTTACSVEVTGVVVASQGSGHSETATFSRLEMAKTAPISARGTQISLASHFRMPNAYPVAAPAE